MLTGLVVTPEFTLPGTPVAENGVFIPHDSAWSAENCASGETSRPSKFGLSATSEPSGSGLFGLLSAIIACALSMGPWLDPRACAPESDSVATSPSDVVTSPNRPVAACKARFGAPSPTRPAPKLTACAGVMPSGLRPKLAKPVIVGLMPSTDPARFMAGP